MESPTILESFNLKLPKSFIEFGFQENYRTITSTAPSTKETEIDHIFLLEDISVFKAIAEKCLPRRPTAHSSLLDSLPRLEKTHRLDTEADVTRISILQLLYPVNIALQEIVAAAGMKIICGSERTGGRDSRFDIQWSLYNNKGEFLKNSAILEIKSTNVIHWDDFKNAAATEKTLEAKMAEAMSKFPDTLFNGNALLLTKQATKYSQKCVDVALFDWTSMFIFDFADRLSTTEEGEVKGTYFSEDRRTRKGMTFRRQLFAFLARALKRYVSMDSR
ncbi:hypothetical protein Plec18167_000426 [Paecilomyces lecythidis]|uniref:Restriction endonuclease n=1 Tax=Paecilomyces lecythidis TaxID=3004212 RepID=A0ABR3YDW1_9EURO